MVANAKRKEMKVAEYVVQITSRNMKTKNEAKMHWQGEN
jgi:hypothetical protein